MTLRLGARGALRDPWIRATSDPSTGLVRWFVRRRKPIADLEARTGPALLSATSLRLTRTDLVQATGTTTDTLQGAG